MEEKDNYYLENFKQALVSTIKSISEVSDCNVTFGEQKSKDYKSARLPKIEKLKKFQDFLSIRATADSEALRLRYCNKSVFDCYLYYIMYCGLHTDHALIRQLEKI